jgi:hypothetical protein
VVKNAFQFSNVFSNDPRPWEGEEEDTLSVWTFVAGSSRNNNKSSSRSLSSFRSSLSNRSFFGC